VQNSKLSPGNLTILIAGVVGLLGSFLAFYKFNIPGFGSHSFSAWSSDAYLLGNATLPAIFGVIMAAQVALTSFASVNLPSRVLGFTWNQIHILLGFQATVMMICWLIVAKRGLSFGIGFFLMLVASIALLVGAVMRSREIAPRL
jgi:hypothetical protein